MSETTTEDYIQLPDGRICFTAAYHLKRGYCCGSGCRYCPFDFEKVREPRRSILRAEQAAGREAGAPDANNHAGEK